MDTVTQIASGDFLLCPVLQWAALVRRIWGYNRATWDTPVLAVWRYDWIEHITSNTMVNTLWYAVEAIVEDVLGLKTCDIGIHSIRLGAAMVTYLGNVWCTQSL